MLNLSTNLASDLTVVGSGLRDRRGSPQSPLIQYFPQHCNALVRSESELSLRRRRANQTSTRVCAGARDARHDRTSGSEPRSRDWAGGGGDSPLRRTSRGPHDWSVEAVSGVGVAWPLQGLGGWVVRQRAGRNDRVGTRSTRVLSKSLPQCRRANGGCWRAAIGGDERCGGPVLRRGLEQRI